MDDKTRKYGSLIAEIVRLIAAALAGFFAGTDQVQAIVWTWWDPSVGPQVVLLCAVPVVPVVRKWYERHSFPAEVGERSMTKQSFKDESDVNLIMARYLKTGILESQMRQVPRYGDFTSAEDYHSCMNRVRAAEELFMRLPAKVRDYVDNDPKKLLELVFDPARVDECRELGLIPEIKEPPAAPAAAGAAAVPPAPIAGGEAKPEGVPAS